jgi:hypothetical protein
MFAGGGPEFVIEDGVAAQVPQEGKHGKDSGRYDKEQHERARCSRSV